jgi:ABC-type lipoprotein release transport system permease subunit
MIRVVLRLGLQELARRRRLVLVMTLVVALPMLCYLLLDAYRAGLASLYSDFNPAFLIVQTSGSMGEFFGSRLPAQLGVDLASRGAHLIVPEIHTFAGTTPENAIPLRGVPLSSYTQVEDFSIKSGRPLQPAEPPRRAMIGVRLAEKQGLGPGDPITIRGRVFQVVGVFAVGTYADFEAWISLSDAQELLGWGSDVSVFVIRPGEGLAPGDQLTGGAVIVQKGESNANIIEEWVPLIKLFKMISGALGIAAAVSLANLLWRLAWQHRRELAVLRSLGFGRSTLALYLLSQGLTITLLGFGFGVMGAFGVRAVSEIRTAGVSIHAVFGWQVILTSLVMSLVIALAGSALPAWHISSLNLAGLLRDE